MLCYVDGCYYLQYLSVCMSVHVCVSVQLVKLIYTPSKLSLGVYWFHPVCLSVHLSVCLSAVDMIFSRHVP